jgi:hypothetical protein
MRPLDLSKAEALLEGILEDQEDLIDQAQDFGFKAARAMALGEAEDIFDQILREQDFLIDQAKDFGYRAAARKLMPLAEAKAIVEGFDKNTAKLRAFTDSLSQVWVSKIPEELKADYDKLYGKAYRALKKFEVDRDKAQKALEAWEDKLVGDNFQKAFQALRMKILDLDPNGKVKFATTLYLDKDPAFASGRVDLYDQYGTHAYRVNISYRADGDEYWGNIWSAAKNHTFKSVVSKQGHTKLPRFIKDLVGQLRALDREFEIAGNPSTFGTRKKAPPLRLQTPTEVAQNLKAPVQKKLEKVLPVNRRPDTWYVTGKSHGFDLTLQPLGWPRTLVPGYVFNTQWDNFKRQIERMKPFKVKGAVDNVTYEVTSKLGSIKIQAGRYSSGETPTEYRDWLLERYPEWADPLPPVDVLKKRAASLGVNIKRFRTAKSIAARIQPTTELSLPRGVYVGGTVTLTVKRITKASQRLYRKALLRLAGGCDFQVVVWVSDPNRAFREGSEDAESEYGHQQGYGGNLHSKNNFRIKNKEPVTLDQAYRDADHDLERNDKWGPAFARAVSNPKVLHKEQVEVIVKARNERDALRKGILRIEATGRIPPNAEPVVEKAKAVVVGGSTRVKEWKVTGLRKEWEVTGLRKLVKAGGIDGWLFYGIAPC